MFTHKGIRFLLGGEVVSRKSVIIAAVLVLLHLAGFVWLLASFVLMPRMIDAFVTDAIRAEQALVTDALTSKDEDKIVRVVSPSALAAADGDQWVPGLQGVLPEGELVGTVLLNIHVITFNDSRSWTANIEYETRRQEVSSFTLVEMEWIASGAEYGLRALSYTPTEDSQLRRHQIGKVIAKAPARAFQLLLALALFVPVWIFVLASIWFMLFRAETKRKIVWSIVMMLGLYFAFFNFTEGVFYLQNWFVSQPDYRSFYVPLSFSPVVVVAGYATPLVLGATIPVGTVLYWFVWWRRGRRRAAKAGPPAGALH